MQFLKTLFWVLLTVVTVGFSLRNWAPVSIFLWSGLTIEMKLPMLILIGVLIGFIPTYAVHRTKMWRMRRRLDTVERNALVAAAPDAVAASPAAPSRPATIQPASTPAPGTLDL